MSLLRIPKASCTISVKFNQPTGSTSSGQTAALIENQSQMIHKLQEKIALMQQDYDKLVKDHNQIRAILVDLQMKVFDVLSKKTNSQIQQVRSHIVAPSVEEKQKEDPPVVHQQQQPQTQEIQLVKEKQAVPEEQLNNFENQAKEVQEQGQPEQVLTPEQPQSISQTNPFATEPVNQIKKPVNPPTPRRIPPTLQQRHK